MTDHEHATSLLRMGYDDLKALEGMINSREFFTDEIFGFHAQQAVEKFLKSWIDSMGERYPFQHDIMILINQLESLEEDVSGLSSLVDLNPFAVQYRYDVLDPDEEKLDRNALLASITELYNRVKNRIES